MSDEWRIINAERKRISDDMTAYLDLCLYRIGQLEDDPKVIGVADAMKLVQLSTERVAIEQLLCVVFPTRNRTAYNVAQAHKRYWANNLKQLCEDTGDFIDPRAPDGSPVNDG